MEIPKDNTTIENILDNYEQGLITPAEVVKAIINIKEAEKEQESTLPVSSLQIFLSAMREVGVPSKQIKDIFTFVLAND